MSAEEEKPEGKKVKLEDKKISDYTLNDVNKILGQILIGVVIVIGIIVAIVLIPW